MPIFNETQKQNFEFNRQRQPVNAAEVIQSTVGNKGGGLGAQTPKVPYPTEFGPTQASLDLQSAQQQRSVDIVNFVMDETDKEILESNTESTEIDRMFLGQEKLGQDTLSPIINKLMKTTESGSGGYNALYDQAQKGTFKGIVPTEMTIGEVLAFQKKRGKGSYASFVQKNNPKGTISTPVGKFQYVGKTLQGEVNKYGYDLTAKFDAGMQNTIFYTHASRLIENEETPAGMRSVIRSTWEGFETVLDKNLNDFIAEIKRQQ